MRFAHLADLHLGKKLAGIDLIDDQRTVLSEIVDIIKKRRLTMAVIAGDVFDKSIPSEQALELFDDFITELAGHNVRVFIISGNHDSAERLSNYSTLLAKSEIYVAHPFDGHVQKLEFKDRFGRYEVDMLPFFKPSNVRPFYPQSKIESYQDAFDAVIADAHLEPSIRHILLCHQFISGGVVSDSEDHVVGGLDMIDASALGELDYVALGHLHKPQHVGRRSIRYAGSPLRYSLSEMDQDKVLPVITIKEKGTLEIENFPLEQPHGMRRLTGLTDELAQMPYSEDFVDVTVTDNEVMPDARVTLSTNFPNMIGFSVANDKMKDSLDVDGGQQQLTRSDAEMFRAFYRYQNNVDPSEPQMEIVNRIIDEIGEEDR